MSTSPGSCLPTANPLKPSTRLAGRGVYRSLPFPAPPPPPAPARAHLLLRGMPLYMTRSCTLAGGAVLPFTRTWSWTQMRVRERTHGTAWGDGGFTQEQVLYVQAGLGKLRESM